MDDEDSSSLWEFDDVTAEDGLITQMAMQEDADGWGCQHALAVVSNMTAETWACAYSLSDEAATMAVDIVNNADRVVPAQQTFDQPEFNARGYRPAPLH